MTPNFEDPLDTAKQLVEKNITLYGIPGAEIWKQFLLESPILVYNILGENYIVANDWDQYYNMSEHDAIGAGTHAQMDSYLSPWELSLGERGWYRSKENALEGNYFAGYLTNKKCHLNEVIK